MSKNKYKRYSRGGRFRNQGDGLRSAVDNIRQQRQTEIDALKLQAQQQKEQSKLQISGLSDVARNKVDNQNIINNLENKIYQNKRNAIDVKGRRDVENILGQAAELGREAEFWEDFATKHSKNYGKLASGLVDFAQYRAAVHAYQNMTEDERTGFMEPYEGAYDGVEKDSETGAYQIPDWKDRKELFKKTHGWLANNHHLHKMLANDYVKTINNRISMVRVNSKTSDGTELYNKDTASQLILNSAYQFLYTNGIPFNSQAGQKILSITNQKITAETNAFRLAKEVKDDAENLEVQTRMLDDYWSDYNSTETPLRYDTVLQPSKGYTSYHVEQFENKFWSIHETIKGTTKLGEGNSGALTPGDPIRAAETHKQQITQTLEHVIKNIKFSSVSEAVNVLNMPVRDLNSGKVILNKKGKPAEYLLDKHPDLKQLVIEQVKTINENRVSDRELVKESKAIANIEVFNDQLKADFKNNDFSNTLWNKDWRVNYFNVISDPKHKNLSIVQDGFDLIGFEPSAFDQKKGYDASFYNQFTTVEQEFYSGDVNGALFQYMKLPFQVPELANIHETLASTLQITDFTKRTNKFIKNEFSKAGLNQSSILNQGVGNQNDLERMVEIGTARFMVIFKDNADIKNHELRYQKTQEQFQAEVEAGLKNRQGWAAATEFDDTGLGQKSTKGYKFDILSGSTNRVVTGEELTQDAVNEMFTGYDTDTSFSSYRGKILSGQPVEGPVDKVAAIINDNFKDIVSINDAMTLFKDISTGQAANNNLPQNIKFFVRTAKERYGLTERETMNLIINAIIEKGDKTWGGEGKEVIIDDQLKNYEWPPSKDDLVKKMGGISTGKYKDNYGLMLNQWLKNQGFNLSDLMVDPEIIKNALGVR